MHCKFNYSGRVAHSRKMSGRFSPVYPPCGIGLALALYLCAPAAFAARPMITDDARITDAKSCQLESWAKKSRDSNEYWALPACNFTGNLELTLGGASINDAAGTYLTDVVFQGKTLFKPMEPTGWSIGLTAGMVHHPQVDGSDWYASVPASFTFKDDHFVLHTNIGWLHEQEAGRHRLTWGIGSETELAERTWLIAETFGQNQGKPLYQMGVRHWILPNSVQIDMTYGNRIGSNADEQWFSIGLRLLSMPFLP